MKDERCLTETHKIHTIIYVTEKKDDNMFISEIDSVYIVKGHAVDDRTGCINMSNILRLRIAL